MSVQTVLPCHAVIEVKLYTTTMTNEGEFIKHRREFTVETRGTCQISSLRLFDIRRNSSNYLKTLDFIQYWARNFVSFPMHKRHETISCCRFFFSPHIFFAAFCKLFQSPRYGWRRLQTSGTNNWCSDEIYWIMNVLTRSPWQETSERQRMLKKCRTRMAQRAENVNVH